MFMRKCQSCGRTLKQGEKCPCAKGRHKAYNQRRDKETAAFYGSPAWAKTRAAVKARACGMDELIFAEEGRIVPGEIVHHIFPVEDAPGRVLDVGNLIFVSRATHRRVHDAYDRGGKAAMQKRLMEAVAWKSLKRR